MCTSVLLPIYLYAYASWNYLMPMKVERYQILWSCRYSYELLCGYWELILDSLQEEQVILTTESYLYRLGFFTFIYVYVCGSVGVWGESLGALGWVCVYLEGLGLCVSVGVGLCMSGGLGMRVCARALGGEVIHRCEPPSAGAGNWTAGICKNSKGSHLAVPSPPLLILLLYGDIPNVNFKIVMTMLQTQVFMIKYGLSPWSAINLAFSGTLDKQDYELHLE